MRLFASRAILVVSALLAALTAANAALGPRYGGELTIAVAPFGSTEPRAGHTAGERLAVGLVHETLLKLAPDGGLQPSLAGGWTTSAAGREWSFTLDPHARFHDDTPLTAAAAALSVRRFLRSSSTAAEALAAALEGGDAFREGSTADLPGLSLSDERRLVLRLARRSSIVLHALTSPAAAVVDGNGRGAGPFAPVLDVPGRRLLARAHSGHVRGRPFLDRVLLLAGAREGQADARFAGTGAPATAATLLLLLDAKRPPFESASARAAVDASIDRRDLASRVIAGGSPRFALLDYGKPGSTADAAVPPARPRLTGSMTLFVEEAVPPAVSQRVVAWLAALGLRAEITVGAGADADRSGASARLFLFQPEVPEAGLVLREALRFTGSGPLRASLDAADAEPDASRRDELLRDIEQKLLAERALLPLAALPVSLVAREGTQGLRFDRAGRLCVEDAWLYPR